MKKNTILIFFMVMASALINDIYAQSLAYERSKCLLSVAKLIEDYEYNCLLDDEEMERDFASLFVSDEVQVYNDLLGLSEASMLPVSEYIKLRRANTHTPRVVLKDIVRRKVERSGDHTWEIQCTLLKEQSYIDPCGILLSSQDFYNRDYELTVNIQYDAETDVSHFVRIEGKIASTRNLTGDWKVFQKTDQRDLKIKYDGQPIKFNSYGQTFIYSDFDSRKFVYRDADVVAIPKVSPECKRLVTVLYKARRMRLKPHFDLGLGGAFSLDNASINVNRNRSNNFGIDFGYVIPLQSIVKPGFFAGVGMSMSAINLEYKDVDYRYNTSADVDGDQYVRHYRDLSIRQELSMKTLTIPVYFDLDIHAGRWVSFYADLGVRLNVGLSNSITNDASAYVYGEYSKYANQGYPLILDEHWGYNGFGNHTYTDAELKDQKIEGLESFSIDLIAGGGVRVNIPSTPLAADLGVRYQMGLTDLISPSILPISTSGKTELTAPVYNTISGLQSTEHVRNLTEAYDKIRLGQIALTFGLLYKF